MDICAIIRPIRVTVPHPSPCGVSDYYHIWTYVSVPHPSLCGVSDSERDSSLTALIQHLPCMPPDPPDCDPYTPGLPPRKVPRKPAVYRHNHRHRRGNSPRRCPAVHATRWESPLRRGGDLTDRDLSIFWRWSDGGLGAAGEPGGAGYRGAVRDPEYPLCAGETARVARVSGEGCIVYMRGPARNHHIPIIASTVPTLPMRLTLAVSLSMWA